MVTVSLTQEEKKKSKLSYFKWRESLVFCEAGEIEIGEIYMKKRLFYVAILCLILTGCGANYTDGTYEAKSSLYEGDSSQGIPGGDYGIVRIRIENGKFIECTYEMYDPDGVIKGSEYGKDSDKELYQFAQKSVQAGQHYAEQLIEKQFLDDVDAVSGATTAYTQFIEAARQALSQAES